MKKKIKKKNILLFLIVILLIVGVLIYVNSSDNMFQKKNNKTYYLKGNTVEVPIYNEKFEVTENLKRGILVTLNNDEEVTDESGKVYSKINYNDKKY